MLDHDRELRRALSKALVGLHAGDRLIIPSSDDAHSDHRAVARALELVPRRGEHRLGYRVWGDGFAQPPPVQLVRLSSAEMLAKRRAVMSYRTQTGIIDDAQAGFAMTHRHLQTFAGPAERYERVP